MGFFKKRLAGQSGFTLIELLVVVAIIGMLSSIVLVSLNNARIKARDAKRKGDIAAIQKALELYYTINNKYPCSVPSDCTQAQWVTSTAPTWDFVLGNAMSSVISKLPHDPKEVSGNSPLSNASDYGYLYFSADYITPVPPGCSGGQWYILVYKLENRDIVSPNGYGCAGDFYNYSATGAGANAITLIGKGK